MKLSVQTFSAFLLGALAMAGTETALRKPPEKLLLPVSPVPVKHGDRTVKQPLLLPSGLLCDLELLQVGKTPEEACE